MKEIKFVVRDKDGRWLEREFDSRDDAYGYCLNMTGVDEDLDEEVMYITVDNVCVYSSLMAEGVDWETLVGWFA